MDVESDTDNVFHPLANKEEEVLAFTPKKSRPLCTSLLFRSDDLPPMINVML